MVAVTFFLVLALACGLALAADGEPARRLRMLPLEPAPAAPLPPSPRELVDARAVVERRFRDHLARARTTAGANAAASALLDAANAEDDTAVKWQMLAEARRLAAEAGNAPAVGRSFAMAAGAYEFDALAEEIRVLRAIPLRALDAGRAAALAGVAEGLAERAEADGRRDVAADSWTLAMRAWQRAGDTAAARKAATHLNATERRLTASP